MATLFQDHSHVLFHNIAFSLWIIWNSIEHKVYLIIWNRYVIFWIATIFQHDCQMLYTYICTFLFVSKKRNTVKNCCMNMDFSISCDILLGVSAYPRMLWPAVMYRVVLPLHQSCRTTIHNYEQNCPRSILNTYNLRILWYTHICLQIFKQTRRWRLEIWIIVTE